MKRKSITFILSIAVCLASLFGFAVLPALANSAQASFEGVDATGAIMPDKESPIIVESETLTFDISEFPLEYYNIQDVKAFAEYSGRVTAEYTFFNPSEYTVTSKLMFPYGIMPDYAYGYYDELGEHKSFDDSNKYAVKINGVEIEKKVRHTLSLLYNNFNLEKDLNLLRDGFIQDSFFSPDLTVTKYTIGVSEFDSETYFNAKVAFDIEDLRTNYLIYFPNSGQTKRNNGQVRLSTFALKEGYTSDFYVIGQPFTEQTLPALKIYKDFNLNDNEIVAGKASYVDVQTTTLKEFALSKRPADSVVSESDWYNALIAEIKKANQDSLSPIVTCENFNRGFSSSLMRWYEYEITLAPNERIVNTVTAPIYPSVNTRYNPDVYEYVYLLSPATTFKSFGELKIVINSPFYQTQSNLEGFVKTDNGYSLTLGGLPEGELKFSMSVSENPEYPSYNNRYDIPTFSIAELALILAIILAVSSAVIVGVLLYGKKSKNK